MRTMTWSAEKCARRNIWGSAELSSAIGILAIRVFFSCSIQVCKKINTFLWVCQVFVLFFFVLWHLKPCGTMAHSSENRSHVQLHRPDVPGNGVSLHRSLRSHDQQWNSAGRRQRLSSKSPQLDAEHDRVVRSPARCRGTLRPGKLRFRGFPVTILNKPRSRPIR